MKDHIQVWLFLVLVAAIIAALIWANPVDAAPLPPIDEGEEIVILEEDCKAYGTI